MPTQDDLPDDDWNLLRSASSQPTRSAGTELLIGTGWVILAIIMVLFVLIPMFLVNLVLQHNAYSRRIIVVHRRYW